MDPGVTPGQDADFWFTTLPMRIVASTGNGWEQGLATSVNGLTVAPADRLATATNLDVSLVWPDNYVELPGAVLTATVTGQTNFGPPTGVVRFTGAAAVLGEVGLTASGDHTAVAALTLPHLAVGDTPFVAKYLGDANYKPSDSEPTDEDADYLEAISQAG